MIRVRGPKRNLRFLLALACLCGSAVPASAQWNYVGFEQITVGATVTGFTAAKINPPGPVQATQAFCSSETADLRWTVDGTTPTTNVGTVLTAGSALPAISGFDLLRQFKAIRDGGSDVTLNCTYFSGAVLTAPLITGGGGGSGGGGGGSVTQGTDPWIVAGSFANDGVAAGSNRVPTLPGIVETSAPTRTNGRNAGFRFFAGGGAGMVLTNAAGTEYELGTDPCANVAGLTTLPISAAADAVLISATASNRTYICDGAIIANAAEIFAIWEGTGSTCGTGTAALVGSTTIGNGVSLAANGGFPLKNIRGISTNVDVCLHLNTTNRVTGYITYIKAP